MKLNLVLNTFSPKNDKDRLDELKFCLEENLKNNHISKIYILHEDDNHYVNNDQQKNPKLTLLKQQGRKTFGELFDFCKDQCKGPTIISNSDVYFNESLLTLNNISAEIDRGLILAQHRYNLTKKGKIIYEQTPSKTNEFSGSADAWIFNPEIPIPPDHLNFLPGTSYCDQHLAMKFFMLNRPVIAARDIQCIHVHTSKVNEDGKVPNKDYMPTSNIVKNQITNQDIKFVKICNTEDIKKASKTLRLQDNKLTVGLEYILQKQEEDRAFYTELLNKIDHPGFRIKPHASHNLFPNAFYNLILTINSKQKIWITDNTKTKINKNPEAEIKKSLVIAATLHNVEKTINELYNNILRYASVFERARIVLTESDSEDATIELVAEINNQLKRQCQKKDLPYIPLDFISLGRLKQQHPLRVERISTGRNTYLDIIENHYSDFDYALFLDADEINSEPISMTSILSNFSKKNLNLNWDMICANCGYKYYDLWALRHPTWMPNDCLEEFENRPDFMSAQEAFNMFVRSKFIHIPAHSEPIKVDSAFGGAAFVKIPSIKGVRSHHLNENGNECADWPSFCKKLKNIYINPAFIIQNRPNEHIWKNQAL